MLRASTATVWFIVVVVSDGCAPRRLEVRPPRARAKSQHATRWSPGAQR